MASCSICSSFGPAKIQYNHVLASEHAKTHFLQLKMVDDGIDMDQIFEQCFPDFAPVDARAVTQITSRKDLTALCRSLISGKSFTSSSPHIVCEKCDEKIKVITRGNTRKSIGLIEHACYHLDVNIYECRQCGLEYRQPSGLIAHLLNKHQIGTMIGHFHDKIDDFAGEISAMIKTCFGGRKKTAHSNGGTIKSKSMSNIRRCTKGSHLATERQLFCYRLIRELADRNGHVLCRLCSKGVKVTVGKKISCTQMREHAFRHFPTPLFRCRLCPEAFFGRSAAETHLRSVHAVPWLQQNVECLADQYHSDIMAMMKKCYSDEENDSGTQIAYRNLSESRICQKSKQSKLTVRRQLLCYQLIRKCATTGERRHVQCRLCSKRISTKTGASFTTSDRVMQHAFLHVGKPMYQCNKCSDSSVSRFGMRKHLEQQHALPWNQIHYQYLADQFHNEVERILRQCYGDEANDEEDADGVVSEETPTSVKMESNEPKSTSTRMQSKLTIERQMLCNQLTKEYGEQQDQRLQCRLCNKRISVKGVSGCSSSNAMLHAHVHLEKPIYRCKICSETFVTRNNVAQHVRTKHALPMPNNYDCLGDQFHSEIVEMLRKCYNNEAANNEAKPAKSRTAGEARVRGGVNGSKQTVERNLYCYRMIRQFINSNGKVECRMCEKRITAKDGQGYKCSSLIMHALIHLRKPIYRCKICSEKRPYLNSIKHHLRLTHALPSANNYESLADEYHSEILAKLDQCYGNKVELSVQKNVKGSKQTAERQLFCHRLITKFLKSDGKVECRLCKKRIAAKNGAYIISQPTFMHSLIHLKKPIYRCTVCFEKRPFLTSLRWHLRAAHDLPLA